MAIATPATATSNVVEDDEPTSIDIPVTTDLKTLLPPVPEGLMNWASETQDRLESVNQFSTVSLSEDRKSAEIYWYGAATDALDEALTAAPAEYAVTVVPTLYEPGELRTAALDLLNAGEFNGSAVTATWPDFDGSGLGVQIDDMSANRGTGATEYQGFPVEVSEGEAAAAIGRQDDNLHLGGSRLVRASTGGRCSLGFSVQSTASSPTDGGMFAAHCGNVGDAWLRPTPTSGTYVSMGSTGAEINNRDGAILTGTFFNPAVYIGSYTSDAYVGITTVNTPVNGTEICYSGSFSGTTCGNIVSQPIYNYSLTGVGNITGLMTANPQGLPAFGNGDSGGPGIAVFQHTDGTLRISASTIISAIPSNNKSANCQGIPGSGPANSTNPNDRQCSHIGIVTRAKDIASSLGYSIKTVP
ncbi:S1 family peptidase [Microbacterium profundi]|uniref:S1 family peptidase n=2 Tax=Microbacteriaceae TaxID=85023 RepID=A0ABV3LGS6_9MICO|nr:S1 family peptidase [Microbacterium profundi]MCE7482944.1 S1 family peptidase [Microbacterium profundi]